ncbi:MAG: hypothetical protein K8R58_01870 [Bacteroidales bacterium]|nr:hypothetical protein [Bacteroidales bacterium]
MKQKILVFGILALIFASCSTGTKKETIQFPYEFVNSKTETAGNNENKMDLYAYSGELNIDTLKMFCKKHKDEFSLGTFYYLVVFDSKKNAVFPSNSFTAAYGIEEEPQKHIRAFYTYNRLNGYSKLDFYKENKWESVAKSEDI